MTLIVALISGFLAGRLVWLLVRSVFRHPVFLRENYRGAALPTGVGITVCLVAIVVEALRVMWGRAGIGAVGISASREGILIATVGFGLLGFIDDMAGDGSVKGFGGHLGSILAGRLTTGSLKLLIGGAVAVLVAGLSSSNSFVQLLIDASLIALCANLGNLFDRAPGRTIKVASGSFAIIAIATTFSRQLSATGVIVGAAAALFLDDMRERIMLGDAGANAVGAAIGAGLVFSVAPGTRGATLIGVAVLNVVSELISFSRVIDSVPPIRAADRAGRRRVSSQRVG